MTLTFSYGPEGGTLNDLTDTSKWGILDQGPLFTPSRKVVTFDVNGRDAVRLAYAQRTQLKIAVNMFFTGSNQNVAASNYQTIENQNQYAIDWNLQGWNQQGAPTILQYKWENETNTIQWDVLYAQFGKLQAGYARFSNYVLVAPLELIVFPIGRATTASTIGPLSLSNSSPIYDTASFTGNVKAPAQLKVVNTTQNTTMDFIRAAYRTRGTVANFIFPYLTAPSSTPSSYTPGPGQNPTLIAGDSKHSSVSGGGTTVGGAGSSIIAQIQINLRINDGGDATTVMIYYYPDNSNDTYQVGQLVNTTGISGFTQYTRTAFVNPASHLPFQLGDLASGSWFGLQNLGSTEVKVSLFSLTITYLDSNLAQHSTTLAATGGGSTDQWSLSGSGTIEGCLTSGNDSTYIYDSTAGHYESIVCATWTPPSENLGVRAHYAPLLRNGRFQNALVSSNQLDGPTDLNPYITNFPAPTGVTVTPQTPTGSNTPITGMTTAIYVKVMTIAPSGLQNPTALVVSASPSGSQDVLISWNAVSGATYFAVYVSTGATDPGDEERYLWAKFVTGTSVELGGALPIGTGSNNLSSNGTPVTFVYGEDALQVIQVPESLYPDGWTDNSEGALAYYRYTIPASQNVTTQIYYPSSIEDDTYIGWYEASFATPIFDGDSALGMWMPPTNWISEGNPLGSPASPVSPVGPNPTVNGLPSSPVTNGLIQQIPCLPGVTYRLRINMAWSLADFSGAGGSTYSLPGIPDERTSSLLGFMFAQISSDGVGTPNACVVRQYSNGSAATLSSDTWNSFTCTITTPIDATTLTVSLWASWWSGETLNIQYNPGPVSVNIPFFGNVLALFSACTVTREDIIANELTRYTVATNQADQLGVHECFIRSRGWVPTYQSGVSGGVFQISLPLTANLQLTSHYAGPLGQTFYNDDEPSSIVPSFPVGLTATNQSPSAGHTAITGMTTAVYVRVTTVVDGVESNGSLVVSSSPSGSQDVLLNWTAVPNASYYNIYVSTGASDPGDGSRYYAGVSGTDSFELSGALPTSGNQSPNYVAPLNLGNVLWLPQPLPQGGMGAATLSSSYPIAFGVWLDPSSIDTCFDNAWVDMDCAELWPADEGYIEFFAINPGTGPSYNLGVISDAQLVRPLDYQIDSSGNYLQPWYTNSARWWLTPSSNNSLILAKVSRSATNDVTADTFTLSLSYFPRYTWNY